VIVLDSSFLIAYRNSRDAHHAKAREVMARIARGEWGDALLPEYVFLETVTVIAARVDQRTATETGEALLAAKELTFVPCSELFLEAFKRFQAQAKPRLSFTDAAMLVVAQRFGADRIATFDEDFRAEKDIKVVPT
jgi:predicted nucleic acid-binding protein